MAKSRSVESRWLTLGEASQILGVHLTTLRGWVDAGVVPSFRTPGGHRRFDVSDLQAFLQQRKATAGPHALTPLTPAPLEMVRQQLSPAQLARQPWYHQLTETQREKEREMGRRMLGLLLQYSGRRANAEHFLEEGRGLARSYGRDLAQTGLRMSDVARAFIFIRRAILHATHQPQDTGAPNDAESMRLYQRINNFMDEMLLSTLDSYEQTSASQTAKHLARPKRGSGRRKN